MKLCAVIPAAGHGTRLGGGGPKILTPIHDGRTIWDMLHEKLAPMVDHIHLVLGPLGAREFPALPDTVSYTIQPEPVGMGDAIFRSYDVWTEYDTILIIWGDQLAVSRDTLQRSLNEMQPNKHIVLPLARMASPYVEYVFEGERLTHILQTREGDTTMPNGLSDVGTFFLNTAGLKQGWNAYLATARKGPRTGEINFLPFLPFLAAHGWSVAPLEVADATEARGINTPEDLAFFRSLYAVR